MTLLHVIALAPLRRLRTVLLLALPLLLSACVSEESWEAVRVLEDIDAGAFPSDLKAMTPPPTRREVRYRIARPGADGAAETVGPEQVADLYHPGRPDEAAAKEGAAKEGAAKEGAAGELNAGRANRGGLVMVPGFTPDGKDDRRLVALARSFARAGFVVLVPDLPGSRETRVRLDDARRIADALVYLSGRPELARTGTPALERIAGRADAGGLQTNAVRNDRVGLVAISYAVGLAVLATTEPDAKEHIGFLAGLGGYYDTTEVVRFTTTGAYRLPGRTTWRTASPLRPAKWFFLASNIDALEDPRDRAALSAIAERRLRSATAPLTDREGRSLVAQLGPEGRALYDLMTNEDPARVEALIAGLPGAVRAQLERLSLRDLDLSHLTGRLILIHGREDPMVPYSESIALGAAVPDTELFLIDGFSHVDPRSVGWVGKLQLADAVQAILARRGSRK